MKDFWSENKGIIGKLVLQQFGTAFFGLSLLLAARVTKLGTVEVVASLISIALYLYLLYNILWEKGGLDRIKIDGGRAARMPLKGLYISLIANIPNIIISILVVVAHPFKETHEWAGNMHVIGRTAAMLWESMYDGLVMNFSPHNPIIFPAMVLPAVIVCTAGYIIGLNNKKLFGFLTKKKQEN